MTLSESLGIEDPSHNIMNQTSNYFGTYEFSPLQQWEMWMSRPEVTIRISDVLLGLLDILAAPSIAKPLSRFLSARSE